MNPYRFDTGARHLARPAGAERGVGAPASDGVRGPGTQSPEKKRCQI
jgi:hypothetical protein